MASTLKDAFRNLTAYLRKIVRKAFLLEEPAYLTQDPDAALAPELDVAAQMRARTFPSLKAYADMRLGADAPSERALADALERSARTIPEGHVGEVSFVSCPCREVVRFVPFENANDLVNRGWKLIESWYSDAWRLKRWRAEAEKSPPLIGVQE
jgi:hypothetical protein